MGWGTRGSAGFVGAARPGRHRQNEPGDRGAAQGGVEVARPALGEQGDGARNDPASALVSRAVELKRSLLDPAQGVVEQATQRELGFAPRGGEGGRRVGDPDGESDLDLELELMTLDRGRDMGEESAEPATIPAMPSTVPEAQVNPQRKPGEAPAATRRATINPINAPAIPPNKPPAMTA